MAQNSGPFGGYLTEAFKPTTPNPTGFEGTGSGVAYLASRFLDGLKQSRMQKFAMQQMEEEKQRRQFEQALEYVSKRDDLLPDVKNKLMNELTLPFIQQVAGVKESGKDTGSALTDVFKQAATGLIGGQLPKGKAPLDPSIIANAFSSIADPNNTINAVTSQAEQAIGQLLSSARQSGPVTQESLMKNPEIQSIVGFVRRKTGNADWLPANMAMEMQASPVSGLAAKQRAFDEKNIDFKTSVLEEMSGTSPAQSPVSAPATSTPPVSAPMQPGTATTPIAATAPVPTNLLTVASNENRKYELAGYKSPHMVDKTPDQYVGQDGKLFQGVYMQSPKYGSGIVDANTGQFVQGARKATANDLNRIPEDQIQSKYAQYVGDLEKAVGREFSNVFAPSIMANLRSGDDKGAADVIGRAVAAKQQSDSNAATRSLAAAQMAQAGDNTRASIMARLGNQFDSSIINKNMITSEQYYRNAIAGARRAQSDPNSASLHDIELLRTWAKMTDPLTGVREGEYRDLQSIIGKLRSAGVEVENLWDAKGNRLDEKGRKVVLDSIKAIHETDIQMWKSQAEKARAQAASAGINPDLIAPLNQFGGVTQGNTNSANKPKKPWSNGSGSRNSVDLPD
jgi:hypothetical protein